MEYLDSGGSHFSSSGYDYSMIIISDELSSSAISYLVLYWLISVHRSILYRSHLFIYMPSFSPHVFILPTYPSTHPTNSYITGPTPYVFHNIKCYNILQR